MSILITGGAGYIGSHAVKRLLEDGRDVVALDNLSRGNRGAIDLLAAMPTGAGGSLTFVEADILDTDRVRSVLAEHKVTEIMHFAALAYVRESVERPLDYYANNVGGVLSILRATANGPVRKIVFSSTCATYGEPEPSLIPIKETCEQRPINPYGWSKLHCERMLFDHQATQPDLSIAVLRYFNVAGSDTEGLLGEDHIPETHIIPLVIQAALGRRDAFTIFGTDLNTPDGTCVRDYIHVQDLVDAHVLALDALGPEKRRLIYNLGIGRGYSVREIVDAVSRAAGAPVNVKEGPRNPADPPTLQADASAFMRDFAWTPRVPSIDDIVASALKWMREHPGGYAK